MIFKQKRVKGQNQKVRRTWRYGSYRITWRREAFGIALPARYQAMVQSTLPNGDVIWDWVSARRLFKTMKAAEEACEKHERLWLKAAEASGIRAIHELFGKVPLGYPVGVKLNRKVYAVLMDTSVRKYEDDDDDQSPLPETAAVPRSPKPTNKAHTPEEALRQLGIT